MPGARDMQRTLMILSDVLASPPPRDEMTDHRSNGDRDREDQEDQEPGHPGGDDRDSEDRDREDRGSPEPSRGERPGDSPGGMPPRRGPDLGPGPGGPEPDGPGNKGGRPQWLFVLWIAISVLVLFQLLTLVQEPDRAELTYSEFVRAVDQGQVHEVKMRGHEVQGTLTVVGRQDLGIDDPGHFRTFTPELTGEELLRKLEDRGVEISAEAADPPWWQALLVGFLPLLLLLGLLVWFWSRMQQRAMSGVGGGPLQFGKSIARRVEPQKSRVRMDDVAGCDNAKREVQEVIDFLKEPDRFKDLGATIPRGILMMGPPGTGKTLMARAVAGEAGVPFFTVTGSEFIEMFVGVGASRVRDLFRQAKENAPSVIFIDELDAIGRSRGAGVGGGHDEREQTLNQILSEMDGFEHEESVVVLAATNRPDVLDAALLRPGRFDRKITLENPHREARRSILGVHTRKVPLADDVDLDQVAASTIGFSGAELANLVNEAALLAGRRRLKQVDRACFFDARDRIMLGEKREEKISERERHVIAYHESGHALLAYLLPHADTLEKVTVIPRGFALGVTSQVPDEERHTYNESYLRDRIGVMFGGRLAESLVFGEVSSGAENDLRQATQLARRMVAHWGMSKRVGPVSLPQSEEHVFLGREIARPREHSETTAALIDEEVRDLLEEIEGNARATLEHHRDALDALARALEERETLTREEIEAIVDQYGPGQPAAEKSGNTGVSGTP